MKNLYHLPTHNPCEDFKSWVAHSSPSRGRKSVFKPAAGPVSPAWDVETKETAKGGSLPGNAGTRSSTEVSEMFLDRFRPGVDFSRHLFFPKFQHACPEHSVSSLQIRQMILFYQGFSERLFNREAKKGSREGNYDIKISCSPLVRFFPPGIV